MKRLFVLCLAQVILQAFGVGQNASNNLQMSPTKMSPGEAYRYSMQPFVDARQAPNDYTDADKWAWRLSIARAKEQCAGLAPFKEQTEELLALGKLCLLGQDFESARAALIAYLGLPKMASAEEAHVLLARAFLGLKWISSAESQMQSLMSVFPYDADIHLAIDQVIDAAEASNNPMDTAVMDRLNDQQLPFTLKALANGGSLKGADIAVDASTLARDALRCAGALRRIGKPKDAEAIVSQVKAALEAPPIATSASALVIQTALARYAMTGQASPWKTVHGTAILSNGTLVPSSAMFTGRKTVIVVFSLAAPASSDVINKIAAALQQNKQELAVKLIAATSYAANAGEDTQSRAVLETLKAFRPSIPARVPLLIAPENELKVFSIDAYPAAIVIGENGQVQFVDVISGTEGSIHRVLKSLLAPQR